MSLVDANQGGIITGNDLTVSSSGEGGTGVDGFYRGLGYREYGRLPGAIRVGPDDDRDEVLLTVRL